MGRATGLSRAAANKSAQPGSGRLAAPLRPAGTGAAATPGTALRRPWNYPLQGLCDNSRMSALIAFCSCPDAASAGRIATALVEERLAACVQYLPGAVSTYRWQGRIERAAEVLLLIKTTRGRLPELQRRLPQLHPYELPELVAVEAAGGLPAYLDWVAAQTLADE